MTALPRKNSQHALLQGILHPLDARCAIDVGAAAIAGSRETRKHKQKHLACRHVVSSIL
jgi:isopentenyl diphosphate isomerase/L-lactate dehydrogenase-like FMN-dependent dehydrogenase